MPKIVRPIQCSKKQSLIQGALRAQAAGFGHVTKTKHGFRYTGNGRPHAANAAKLPGSRETGCYVYALIDPRDGRPFYIGKGRGDRCYQNLNDWKRGNVQNTRKHVRISQIKSSGLEPDIRILRAGMPEDRALRLKTVAIELLGKALTNSSRR